MRDSGATSSLEEVAARWCTERSSGNSVCQRHSSQAGALMRPPCPATTANSVLTALLRTSGRTSVLRPCNTSGQPLAL